jgi:hypothetical protein
MSVENPHRTDYLPACAINQSIEIGNPENIYVGLGEANVASVNSD